MPKKSYRGNKTFTVFPFKVYLDWSSIKVKVKILPGILKTWFIFAQWMNEWMSEWENCRFSFPPLLCLIDSTSAPELKYFILNISPPNTLHKSPPIASHLVTQGLILCHYTLAKAKPHLEIMVLAKESSSLWLQKPSKLSFFWGLKIIFWRKISDRNYLENDLLQGDHKHHVKNSF